MLRLVTVILHYGPVSRTRVLHEQLLASDPECQNSILVFDNASSEPYPDAWIRMDQNLYWAGAFEHVMEVLVDQGATHVWFLNNDILFESSPFVIRKVVARLGYLERKIGPVGVYSPTMLRNPYHAQMVHNRSGQFRKVYYVDGIAPLVNLDFWKACGGVDFDGNPFGYGVDVWFSSKTNDYGYACIVDHQIVVRHEYHSTAREMDGFLLKAAEAERHYLSQRLGASYREILAAWATQVCDFQ